MFGFFLFFIGFILKFIFSLFFERFSGFGEEMIGVEGDFIFVVWVSVYW